MAQRYTYYFKVVTHEVTNSMQPRHVWYKSENNETWKSHTHNSVGKMLSIAEKYLIFRRILFLVTTEIVPIFTFVLITLTSINRKAHSFRLDALWARRIHIMNGKTGNLLIVDSWLEDEIELLQPLMNHSSNFVCVRHWIIRYCWIFNRIFFWECSSYLKHFAPSFLCFYILFSLVIWDVL